MDYEILKKRMVQEQLIPRGIKDERLLNAFAKVPRHKFIPNAQAQNAYGDHPLPIGENQTISQPYIVALMTESLKLKMSDKVLEVGTGSGYQTAILAEIAKEVYTIERYLTLADNARGLLSELGYSNIQFKIGDGTLGWQEFSPFDKIIITAATSKLPPPLIEQLKEEGKIIAPMEENFHQMLTLFTKTKQGLNPEPITECVFVPLVGKYGTRFSDSQNN